MATQALSGAATEAIALENLAEAEESAKRRVHPLAGYFARRIGLYLITLWGAFTLAFLFVRLTPGDPINAMIADMARQGQYSTGASSEAMVEYYKKEFGLDGSLLEQYARYMEQLILHQNFGPSILSFPNPATDAIWRALPWTLGLIGVSTIISWVIGVLVGTFVGRARKSRLAGFITYFSLGLLNIPAYFVALFLVIFFGYRNPIFPPNGAYNASLEKEFSWPFIKSVIEYGTLPTLSLIARWLRRLADYHPRPRRQHPRRRLSHLRRGQRPLPLAHPQPLRAAQRLASPDCRTRHRPRGRHQRQHPRRAPVPLPGVGNLLIEAVTRKDVNTFMGIITLFIFGVLTINLIIDLCLPLIDPRIKHSR